MKRLLGLTLALVMVILPSLASARSYHYSSGRGHSYRAYGLRTSHSTYWKSYTPKLASTPKFYCSSYKAASSWSGVYKTTGVLKVNRSESARNQFLRSQGLSKVPAGCEVDHVVPLSHGGADAPFNMQLLPAWLHHWKTAQEQKK